jgi:hypothetical protein
VLSSFSKVFEKVMYNQLHELFSKYSILAEQFGFTADSSTDKAIYKLVNETLQALNSQSVVGGVFFILKKHLII